MKKYKSFEEYVIDTLKLIIPITTGFKSSQISYVFDGKVNYFTYYKNTNKLWINYREIYCGFVDDLGIFSIEIFRKIIRNKIKEYLKLNNKVKVLRN